MKAFNTRAADYTIRAQRAAMVRKVKNLIEQNKQLNDAFFVLSENPLKVKKMVRKFTDKLYEITIPYFGGVGIDKPIKEARKTFIKNLMQYTTRANVEKKLLSEKKLIDSIKNDFIEQINTLVNTQLKNITTKNQQLRLLANAEAIKKEHVQELLLKKYDVEKHGIDVIGARASTNLTQTQIATLLDADSNLVQIGGKIYNKTAITKSWDALAEKYGAYDTIPYLKSRQRPDAGFKNYPIRSYLDGKATTAAREAHNTANSIDSASMGILTVKFSSHGASDSCVLHEGEIAFISDSARETYQRNFGFADFRTVAEIQSDNTHMLKFNCKHIYTPWPIQFFDEAGRAREQENSPYEEIPKKINEDDFKRERRSA